MPDVGSVHSPQAMKGISIGNSGQGKRGTVAVKKYPTKKKNSYKFSVRYTVSKD